ncbi:hypothetical protein LX16_1592 [Stackebrandtia albiflava]|uniref:Translation initiation factor n=1 Tax=Stackebrandtia albiflava TaxID=406432 RepID=A0A562VDB4_9ACTN|nr:hypothetical protein [Stackebrandtia albiflava]TWJ15873.1 hypothetical protein LX16_1592 [Stackebrandtia albiflava]
MGLSTSDVAGLAETLAAGKHPKVVFTEAAGQIAGRTGKVVRLEDPRVDDFVVVRFGHDELPFSPAEVRVPARGELSRKSAVKSVPVEPENRPPAGPPLLDEVDNGGRTSGSHRVKESGSMEDAQPAVPQQSAGEGAVAPAPRKKTAKAKQAPELSVTLSWKDGEWSVGASKGTKVIAKPVPVKAATAVEMVQSLDSPAVAAVVEEIVEQQRQETADEAERLRQQLAAVEARLAELS